MKKHLLVLFLLIYTFRAEAQVTLADDCESLTGWGGGGNALSLDTADPVQGKLPSSQKVVIPNDLVKLFCTIKYRNFAKRTDYIIPSVLAVCV